ncbi:TPA: hypothetical protein JLP95_000346 [Escherichia coli]|nr:hypothetical protein [Escherichia coli]
MFYPNDTYRNLVGDNYKPSQEAIDKKEFSEAINRRADAIVNMLPSLLHDILDKEAAMLFTQLPDCMKEPDKVTHEVFTAQVVRRLLAGRVANILKRGFNEYQ